MTKPDCEQCIAYVVQWHEKKTDYENAAKKIRRLKAIIKRLKSQTKELGRETRQQRRRLTRLNALLELQDGLLSLFAPK